MPVRWCECKIDVSSYWDADNACADCKPDAMIGLEITPMAAKILSPFFRSSALYELPDA